MKSLNMMFMLSMFAKKIVTNLWYILFIGVARGGPGGLGPPQLKYHQ